MNGRQTVAQRAKMGLLERRKLYEQQRAIAGRRGMVGFPATYRAWLRSRAGTAAKAAAGSGKAGTKGKALPVARATPTGTPVAPALSREPSRNDPSRRAEA